MRRTSTHDNTHIMAASSEIVWNRIEEVAVLMEWD